MMLYPLVIALVALTFLNPLFKGRREVYQGTMLLTFLVSLFDGLKAAGIEIAFVEKVFGQILPLYGVGLGWLLPAIVGGIGGAIVAKLSGRTETPAAEPKRALRAVPSSSETDKGTSAGD